MLFYYDIFPKSREVMAELDVKLHYLATWWDVLQVAKASGHFQPEVLAEVERFLHQPGQWSAEHGGIAEFGQQRDE